MRPPKSRKALSAKDLDSKVEAGEDITAHLDLESGVKKVNVDFPLWMVRALDLEAKRLGVARQALIKMWIGQRLEDVTKQSAG